MYVRDFNQSIVQDGTMEKLGCEMFAIITPHTYKRSCVGIWQDWACSQADEKKKKKKKRNGYNVILRRVASHHHDAQSPSRTRNLISLPLQHPPNALLKTLILDLLRRLHRTHQIKRQLGHARPLPTKLTH